MEQRERGRPKKPPEERASERVEIRITPQEREKLERLAKKMQVTKTKTILKGLEMLERGF